MVLEFLYRILAFFASVIVTVSGSVFPQNDAKPTDYQTCKNVIYLIGDGMGFNTIKMAEQVLGKKLTAFDGFELSGKNNTWTALGKLLATDSAAGGTALATGVRISSKSVGVYPDDIDAKNSYPMNLTELAVSQGKATGIVTTAKTYDATPAAFSAHVSYREKTEEIHRQQCASDLTLLWGANDDDLDRDYIENCGFEIVKSKYGINELQPGQRSFGLFYVDFWHNDERGDYVEEIENEDGTITEEIHDMPTLYEMTEKAVDLLDDDEDGFFLMVEAAHIDKRSDKWDKTGMAEVMDGFDQTIRFALDYAKQHGDTLVVLTADHETGGIIEIGGKYIYTTTNHTGKNVPLYVYGCSNFMAQGEVVENREIGRRVACVMGEKNFPIEVKVK